MSDQTAREVRPRTDLRDIVREAIQEFVQSEQRKAEPVYKAELQDERKRRESLEAKLNQLVDENRKVRAAAEEADRHEKIRAELQRTGISKIDLAFRAVKDEIIRAEDGQLQSKVQKRNHSRTTFPALCRKIRNCCRLALQAGAVRKTRRAAAYKNPPGSCSMLSDPAWVKKS